MRIFFKIFGTMVALAILAMIYWSHLLTEKRVIALEDRIERLGLAIEEKQESSYDSPLKLEIAEKKRPLISATRSLPTCSQRIHSSKKPSRGCLERHLSLQACAGNRF